MLWRNAYSPRVLDGDVFPTLSVDCDLVAGGFDLRAQGEIGIWVRLFQSGDIRKRFRILLIAPAWNDASRNLAEAVFPRSLHAHLQFVEDPGEAWREALEPDRPERSFAAVVSDGAVLLGVVGPPTEEVWDQFLARAAEAQF